MYIYSNIYPFFTISILSCFNEPTNLMVSGLALLYLDSCARNIQLFYFLPQHLVLAYSVGVAPLVGGAAAVPLAARIYLSLMYTYIYNIFSLIMYYM